MGIRFTGITTPIGGLEWEYTDKKNSRQNYRCILGRKYASLSAQSAEKKNMITFVLN